MIRSIQRTLGAELARDIALVCLAVGIVGLSFGAIAVGSGFDLWVPTLLSVVVFAGAAQFVFVGLVAAGGSPLSAVLAGLLVNARHLPFGFAMGDILGRGWTRRIVGSHLMVDEAVAFALAQHDPRRRTAAYWMCGIGVFLCWNTGVLIGAYAGAVVTDTGTFGLDAAFPAALLALIMPALRNTRTRRAALTGMAIALVTTPLLPSGLPVLLAVLGVLPYLRTRPPKETAP